MSSDFQNLLSKHNIIHQTIAPRTPGQNGIAEITNRTLMEAARSILHGEAVPVKMWAEAVNCAAYVLNQVPSFQLERHPSRHGIKLNPALII